MDAASGLAGVLWWAGIVVLFIVVIPVVLYLAHRLLSVVREINSYAEDILEYGVAITGNLDPVPVLVDTRDLVKSAGSKLAIYAQSVDKLLAAGP